MTRTGVLPFDLVKTRIQSQLGSDDGAQYKGIADGADLARTLRGRPMKGSADTA